MHFLRKYRLSNPFLLALLFAAGSAQASVCISVIGFDNACGYPGDYAAEQIPSPIGGMEVLWPTPPVIAIEPRHYDRRNEARGHEGAGHHWTTADAENYVHDWQRRQRPHDFDDFRRQWHHDNDHDRGHCDDGDLPRPVPLPGAVLLFGPALLMLRAFQRRNA